MQLETISLARPRSVNWLVVTSWIWCVLCTALLVRAWLTPESRTVHLNYTRAGQHWLEGTDAYDLRYETDGKVKPGMGSYRYSPLFSAAFAPLSMLPHSFGALLWRLINYATFLVALAYFLREVVPGGKFLSDFQQAAWWMLVLPLSLPSMNNGQANVLMLALILAAATAVMRQCWSLAAIALAGAFYLKLYPLAIALLFVLIYPRQLGWRFAVALVAGLLLPFVLQDPRYVWSAYQNWYYCLANDVRNHFPMDLAYRDFYLLTRWVGYPWPEWLYATFQMATAAGVAVLCLLGRRAGWAKQYLVHTLVLLGCCWLIVFGPATESCTYILLAPGTAWALLDAFINRRSLWTKAVLAAVVLLCGTNSVANWFSDARFWCFPMLPLAGLLFFMERCRFVFVAAEAPEPTTMVRTRAA